jgi:hypothetical protein
MSYAWDGTVFQQLLDGGDSIPWATRRWRSGCGGIRRVRLMSNRNRFDRVVKLFVALSRVKRSRPVKHTLTQWTDVVSLAPRRE